MSDPSELERLLQLQTVDSSLDQAAYRKAHLDERASFNAAKAAADDARRILQANESRRTAIDLEYASLENAGKQIDTKVSRLEGQMRNVVVTREAEAIQREIATLRAERDHSDEQGLVLLDESESLLAAMPEVQARIDTAAAAEDAARAVLVAAEATLEEQTAALRTERAGLVEVLPGELLARYERMRPSFKGVAVAKLQGSRCTGCHLDLSRVEIEAVRAVPADEIPECPQCARILVQERRA